MNIPRLLLIASFAWLSSFGMMYLLKRWVVPIQAPAPLEEIILNRTIDFEYEPKTPAPRYTVIETPGGTWKFSTHGACLEQVMVKHDQGGSISYLAMLPELGEQEREKRAFLAVLPEKTPYYYELKSVTQDSHTAVITYFAHSPKADIEKIFTVNKDAFKLDLVVKLTPRTADPVFVRIFYPAPHLQELGEHDFVQAAIKTPAGSLQKVARSSIAADAWWQPAIFGVEDKFFATVLYRDTNSFVQRAFYHVAEQKELYAILQGPAVTNPAQWQLSFYVGPKDEHALAAVDKSLEDLLDYSGLLAPISKFLAKILQWLFSLVHNYGLAIILLTVLINLILLPFNIKSLRSAKKDLEFQKKIEYVKQKYKHDPEALQREQAELFAKHGMPFLGGCLPKLAQFPIFIALTRVFSNSLSLYKAPFFGWIHDLSAPDPYYILPLSIFVLWITQMTTATDIKQRFVMMAVALMISAAATGFSAGQCLYIIISLVLSFLQMWLTKKLKWA